MSAMMRQFHTLRVLSTIALTTLAIAARAAGIREIVIPADHEKPAIAASLWSPCASPPGAVEVSRGTFRREISGVNDCAPSMKQLPLIVISHGMLEDRLSQLAESDRSDPVVELRTRRHGRPARRRDVGQEQLADES